MPNSTAPRQPAISGHKFLVLFSYLLFALILYPFVKEDSIGYFVFRVIGSAGILLMLYAISLRRTLLVLALLLAIPALSERILLPKADAGALSILNIVLSFVFDVFVVVVIFRKVFTNQKPTSETIFGALCIYLLVGFSFASLYGMIGALQPRAFYLNPLTNLHATPDRFDYVYYSFATMTSLGATGITAVSNQARSLAIIETTLGVLYLAVLIARLISAYRHPSTLPQEDAQQAAD